jgi:CheY-like chemotaxis protein
MKAQKAVALVVEDEWLLRMEIADSLREADWEVLEASSGEGALAFLTESKRIDLLVTDIRLAGPLNGWEVAEAYRARIPNIGVIYASANAADLARQVPESIFLEKPCRIDTILELGQQLRVPKD